MNDAPTLTPPTAGKRVGMSAAKIRLLIEAGELKAIDIATRPGKRPIYRIRPSALEEFLRRRSDVSVRGRQPFARSKRPAERRAD